MLVPLALPLLIQPDPESTLVRLDGRTMGTSWQASLVVPPRRMAEVPDVRNARNVHEAARSAIDAELDLVIGQMSPWEPDSVLSRFNAAPAGTRLHLPPELFHVLEVAEQIARDSDGACDATMGELVDLWGFGPPISWRDPGFTPPSPARIEAALGRSGWTRLALDRRERSALQPGGLRLDLSAIAKGHAVDRISRRLAQDGLPHHLVDVGGELRGSGIKPGGQPWWVGIEAPTAPAAQPGGKPGAGPGAKTQTLPAPAEAVVALCGLSVATSGDYRRWFDLDGHRQAHTIDPRTGRPLRNDLAAVTVITTECIRADALSTALMVLGADAGPAWADARDIAARFLRRSAAGLVETTTRAWRAMLE